MTRPVPAEAGTQTLAARLLAALRGAVEGFRRQDRYFKMRAGIGGGWAFLTLVALWIAWPSSGPTNPLGADVRVLPDSLVGGEQILVRNESDEIWTEVTLLLDDGWRHERKTLRSHDQLVLSLDKFMRDGRPAPPELKPRTLTIDCDQGRHVFDLR
jgi:hypothetical protein